MAFAIGTIALATGCAAGRGPNRFLVTGVRLAGSGGEAAGATGLVAAEAGAEHVIVRGKALGLGYRGGVALGLDDEGLAGAARLAANVGWQLDPALGLAGEPLHTVHVRVGVDGRYASTGREGLSWIEAPTLAVGYTFHGQGTGSYADTMHLHVGPRASLALVGAFSDGAREVRLVTVPDLGGELVFSGEGTWLTATYHAFVTDEDRVDLFEASACAARVVAACLDTRLSALAPTDRAASSDLETFYFGLTVGVGVATGVNR